MSAENKPVSPVQSKVYTPLTADSNLDQKYSVRDGQDKKIDIADLFSHFTANIIKEDTTFTR
ncbi:MAG: hypothetical protein ABIQ88_19815 [Chitinophagaceae bacterium]